jgi:hypothetical protein
MLDADVERGGARADSRIVLNDVVFTKAALSRIIEVEVLVGGRPGHHGEGGRPHHRQRDGLHRPTTWPRRTDRAPASGRDDPHAHRAAYR